MTDRVLDDQQLAFFREHLYLALDDAFPRELAEHWTRTALGRVGVDPDDRATWPTSFGPIKTDDATGFSADLRHFSPRAWRAVCELVGGEERIDGPIAVNDKLILNTGHHADQPWRDPGSVSEGWHVDGDHNQFIDQPERGLMLLYLFTDVHERGGSTWIAPGATRSVLRTLLDHPQGLSARVLNGCFDHRATCDRFLPANGPAGRIWLLHPCMLHTVGPNPLRRLRAIRNGVVPLREPMRFDPAIRPLSVVERITVDLLGDDLKRFEPPIEELRHPTDHDTGARLPRKLRRTAAERAAAFTVGAEELARFHQGATVHA